jgi:hypothetical protein
MCMRLVDPRAVQPSGPPRAPLSDAVLKDSTIETRLRKFDSKKHHLRKLSISAIPRRHRFEHPDVELLEYHVRVFLNGGTCLLCTCDPCARLPNQVCACHRRPAGAYTSSHLQAARGGPG